MSENTVSRFSILQQVVFIVLIFSAGFALYIGISGYIFSTTRINGPIYRQLIQGKDLIADILPPPEYIIESYLVVLQAEHDTSGQKLELYQKTFARLNKDYEERQNFWQKQLPDGEIKKLFLTDASQPAREFFQIAQSGYFPAIARGDLQNAKKLLTEQLSPRYEKHRKAVDKVVELVNAGNISIEESSEKMISRFIWIQLAVIIAVISVTALLVNMVVRSIVNSLNICARITSRIATGDLTVYVPSGGRGVVRDLLASLHNMNEYLKEMVSAIAATSSTVASSSRQLSGNAEQLASGTEDMASQAESVATASEEMSATSATIARNCNQAAESSSRASQATTTGSEVVSASISIMEQISRRVQSTAETVKSLGDRSEQIGAIVATIEDIADQTNLLALNAAIEAARAGEMGRGFAVVADEVRALAERTTRATHEIGVMIKTIQHETQSAVAEMQQGVSEVEQGSIEAGRSGEALKDILVQINEVTMQINQIATAAEQQTATTSGITNNISRITNVVQETSRGAYDSAGAARELHKMAENLQALVQRFRLS